MLPILSSLIRSIHLLFIATFLGLQIASYYYVIMSRRGDSLLLQKYTLSLILFIDWILLIIIACIYLSCAYLVYHMPTLSYTTPWVHAACIFLAVVVLCFCANMFIQYKNLQIMKQENYKVHRKYNKIMHVNYILIILLLLFIIHDAVTRSTFLWV